MLGEHTVNVRLTMDLVPEIKVVIYREGEAVVLEGEPETDAESGLVEGEAAVAAGDVVAAEVDAEAVAELEPEADLDSEEAEEPGSEGLVQADPEDVIDLDEEVEEISEEAD